MNTIRPSAAHAARRSHAPGRHLSRPLAGAKTAAPPPRDRADRTQALRRNDRAHLLDIRLHLMDQGVRRVESFNVAQP